MPDKKNYYYLRLSKEDGDVAEGTAEESCSIAAQRLCIRRYLHLHPELGEAFEEVLDDGYSGTSFQRPGIARLLRLAEVGQVGTIIVRDLSRFARNYLEAGHFLEVVFPASGVRFISVNDGYDSASLGETTAGFQLAIRNLMNQLYSKDLSRKIKSAMDLKKRSGAYVYGTAPYGYRKGAEKNTIVVDPAAARTVQAIFDWAAAGVTVTQIAGRLNEAKVPTPSQYLQRVRGRAQVRPYWTFDSVKNILINRIYTGDTIPFKSRVVRVGSKSVKYLPEEEQVILRDTHEAIVSREVFDLARMTIRAKRTSKAGPSSSLLTGYLVCGCCGNKLKKGRGSSPAFRCATARYALEADCRSTAIEEIRVETILLRAIQTQCQLADAQIRAARDGAKSGEEERADIEKQLKLCLQRQNRLQARTVRRYEELVSGVISKEAFLLEKESGKAEVEYVILQQREWERKLAELSPRPETGIRQKLPLAANTGIPALTAELLRELVKQVIVFPDRSLRIVWTFPNVGLENENNIMLSHLDITHERKSYPTGW